jgi:predicted TPR repeat methyltransferase
MYKSEYDNMYTNEMKHWWYVTLHNLILKIIKQHFGSNKQISILDAGCGTGGFLAKLKGYSIIEGFDFSENAIQYCHQRGLEQCYIQDLNSWQTTKKYDVIVSSDVLYHKNIIDDQLILNRFYDALNPGGILILNLPAFELLKRKHDIVVETKKRYTKRSVTNLFLHSKFQEINITYRLPFFFFVVLFQKFFEKIRSTETSDIGSVPSWMNHLLIAILHLENKLLLLNLKAPFGTSVLCVLKK